MEYFISFIISVAAGIVTYYICKILDRDKTDSKRASNIFPVLDALSVHNGLLYFRHVLRLTLL